jgi:hypothetical protein
MLGPSANSAVDSPLASSELRNSNFFCEPKAEGRTAAENLPRLCFWCLRGLPVGCAFEIY